MPPRTFPDELSDMVVGDLMNRWPQVVPVMLRHRMACPGCLMAPFMTLAEAAIEHRIPPRQLARELAEVIESPSASAETVLEAVGS